MSADTPQEWLATARTLAEQAAVAVMQMKDGPLNKQRKADKSIVTAADLKADQILREGLQAAVPEHSIITEESGLHGTSDAEYVWLIDPLDGTKAFAKGIPGFAVMVGLLQQGQPYLGVVVDPIEGRTYEAIRGGGASITEAGERRALHVSDRADYTAMRLVV